MTQAEIAAAAAAAVHILRNEQRLWRLRRIPYTTTEVLEFSHDGGATWTEELPVAIMDETDPWESDVREWVVGRHHVSRPVPSRENKPFLPRSFPRHA